MSRHKREWGCRGVEGTFISLGKGQMYNSVYLHPYGWKRLQNNHFITTYKKIFIYFWQSESNQRLQATSACKNLCPNQEKTA
jgi:hypothetical protein